MPPDSTTVLVTGASRGIGLAIVSTLLGKVKHMTGSTFHINGGSYLI